MPKKPRRRRDLRSCLTGGQPGNVAYPGSAGSHPPIQPAGPTHPGGRYRSSVFRWLRHPPEPNDEG